MPRAAVLKIGLLAAAVGLFSSVASAQQAISITWSADLRFGDIVPGSAPGAVTISPAGARSVSGGVIVLGSNYGAASFVITGEAGRTYAITLPSSIAITYGLSDSMTVDTFTSNPTSPGTLDAAGNGTLTVGATLHVAAGQAPGSYTGTFDVSVDYQ